MAVELITDAPARVVAVFAHPDDADVSCGATLALWSAAGSEIHVVICATGDKGSSDPVADIDALVARRAGELEASLKIVGVTKVHQLGRRDGEFENDLALRGEIVALLRALRPDALICPDPTAAFFGEHYFNHRDHRIVGWAALDAAAPAASSPLYFPEAGPAFGVSVAYLSGSLEPNVFVDVGTTIEQKVDAVLCHATQLGESDEWVGSVVRARAEETGREAGVTFAEAFRRIQLGE